MTQPDDLLDLGAVRFDLVRGEVRNRTGVLVALRPQSLEVLRVLAAQAGTIATKDKLISTVWSGISVTDDSLTQCIADIRRAIGDDEHQVIKTIPRRGYMLVPQTSTALAVEVVPRLMSRVMVVVGLLVAVSAGTGWWLMDRSVFDSTTRSDQTASVSGPSLAVLPFEVTLGDERWSRIGRGLAADIAGDLARNRWLHVVAPDTALSVTAPPREAGQMLQVGFVLDGKIQTEGVNLRVSAQLVDTESGNIVWSDRWHRPSDAIFAVQDEIVERIGSTLGSLWTGAVASTERGAARQHAPRNLDAYELMLLGAEEKHRYTPEGFDRAVIYLEQALELEPEYVQALTTLSIVKMYQGDLAQSPQAAAALYAKSFALGRRALEIDPTDPQALLRGCAEMMFAGRFAEAEDYARKAVELAPNNADVLAVAAWSVPFGGAAPLDWITRAIALNPNHPNWYFAGLGEASFFVGEFDAAAAALRRGPDSLPETDLYLAATEALRGEKVAARTHAARFLEKKASLAAYFGADVRLEPAFAPLVEGAALAGIPATAPSGIGTADEPSPD